MSEAQGYVLGQSADAARRLEIQDAHFADVSERLLDEQCAAAGLLNVVAMCGDGKDIDREGSRG